MRRHLQITYDAGRPLVAYLGFSRPAGTSAARTRELGEGLVVDFDSEGTPLGLEIVNPEIVTGEQLNDVLEALGIPVLSAKELRPFPAA